MLTTGMSKLGLLWKQTVLSVKSLDYKFSAERAVRDPHLPEWLAQQLYHRFSINDDSKALTDLIHSGVLSNEFIREVFFMADMRSQTEMLRYVDSEQFLNRVLGNAGRDFLSSHTANRAEAMKAIVDNPVFSYASAIKNLHSITQAIKEERAAWPGTSEVFAVLLTHRDLTDDDINYHCSVLLENIRTFYLEGSFFVIFGDNQRISPEIRVLVLRSKSWWNSAYNKTEMTFVDNGEKPWFDKLLRDYLEFVGVSVEGFPKSFRDKVIELSLRESLSKFNYTLSSS